MFRIVLILAGCSLIVAALTVFSEASSENEIESILIHPPFRESYSCSEHYAGQFKYLGDELGTDCTIGRLVEKNGRKWMREYVGDGSQNDDWFGWGAEVLAPCDCIVSKVHVNAETTTPGILGQPPASSITFEREDGTKILFAHISDPRIGTGERVQRGQVIASVGNNGYSRQPHVHIGAWRGETPLQIRFDQTKMGPDRKT